MVETPAKTIRLLLVDDHTLFRESVSRLLGSETGFQIVANCGTSAEALQILKHEVVDLILLDLDLGKERGEDLLKNLLPDYAGKVLLLTAGVAPSRVPELIRNGIAGVFTKHSPPELLIQAIHEAVEGKTWFEQGLLQSAMQSDATTRPTTGVPPLTERERQVLRLVFEGLANKEIASRLNISESAVKASLQQLFAKTGVRTRTQLVRAALDRYRDQI